jgi:hypothetical protein
MADMATLTGQQQALKHIEQAQSLIDQIQGKIRKVVEEFACGEVSREQFNSIYEHYQSQMMMAAQMMAEADTLNAAAMAAGETFAIRSKLTAKAKAMTVFYHATALLLETIGDLDIPVNHLSPRLNNICDQVQAGLKVETHTEKLGNEWLLYVPGKYSTAVLLLSNEPAGRQIGIIEQFHRDFETANDAALRSGRADSSKLVFTFQSFVRRSSKKQ